MIQYIIFSIKKSSRIQKPIKNNTYLNKNQIILSFLVLITISVLVTIQIVRYKTKNIIPNDTHNESNNITDVDRIIQTFLELEDFKEQKKKNSELKVELIKDQSLTNTQISIKGNKNSIKDNYLEILTNKINNLDKINGKIDKKTQEIEKEQDSLINQVEFSKKIKDKKSYDEICQNLLNSFTELEKYNIEIQQKNLDIIKNNQCLRISYNSNLHMQIEKTQEKINEEQKNKNKAIISNITNIQTKIQETFEKITTNTELINKNNTNNHMLKIKEAYLIQKIKLYNYQLYNYQKGLDYINKKQIDLNQLEKYLKFDYNDPELNVQCKNIKIIQEDYSAINSAYYRIIDYCCIESKVKLDEILKKLDQTIVIINSRSNTKEPKLNKSLKILLYLIQYITDYYDHDFYAPVNRYIFNSMNTIDQYKNNIDLIETSDINQFLLKQQEILKSSKNRQAKLDQYEHNKYKQYNINSLGFYNNKIREFQIIDNSSKINN